MADWNCFLCVDYHSGTACTFCDDGSRFRKMTNADKIRNMSDSDLAHFLEDIDKFWNEGDLECCVRITDITIHDDYISILELLQSEVE